MKKLIVLIVAVLLISSPVISQEATNNIGVAVGVSASTNGLGGSAIVGWKDKLALRLSYEALNLSFPNAMQLDQEDFTFNVSPDFKSGGFSMLLDWYFLKSVYLSGGLMFTNLNMIAAVKSDKPMKIGDIEYAPEEIGEMRIEVVPQNKVAPYLALGFGRNISRDNKLAMSFEVGAYHTGSFVINASGTEWLKPNGDPANQESINNLNETLKGTSFSGIYPVLKLGISYKLYGAKK